MLGAKQCMDSYYAQAIHGLRSHSVCIQGWNQCDAYSVHVRGVDTLRKVRGLKSAVHAYIKRMGAFL